MMNILEKGLYRARLAQDAEDIDAAQRLRWQAFHGDDAGEDARDADAQDALCRHILIENRGTGALVGCFRLLDIADGTQIPRSYSARFYDLSALAAYPGPMAELGRFCVASGREDPDIVRLAWASLTRLVDERGVEMLFGCTSFKGTDPSAFADAFGLLQSRHLGPDRWRPAPRAGEVVHFRQIAPTRPDPQKGARAMPALLRAYLAMGGWVGDHAVIDRDLGTIHVFTGLETSAIPEGRMRLLRAVAG